MTSERKKDANRRNARQSTGPTSAAGKAVSRLNAVRHGLLAHDAVLPDEDAAAFDTLRREVLADLAPRGPVETMLAERVVNAMWRLRRLERAETGLFYWRAQTVRASVLCDTVLTYEESPIDRILHDFEAPVVKNESAHSAAQDELARVDIERNREETFIGRAFDADARGSDTFGKLSRYEAGLERALYRALYELRQCREARQDEAVIVPDAAAA